MKLVKMEKFSTTHLKLISLFIILGITLNAVVFIYETVLLGIVLDNGVVFKETLSSIFWFVIMGAFLVIVHREINARKKGKN